MKKGKRELNKRRNELKIGRNVYKRRGNNKMGRNE